MGDRKLISFDWAMKKLLRSKVNFGILEGFLSELLNEDICILEVLESESNKENYLDRQNRVDLKVKNSKGEIVLIEVQNQREYDYLQRILYASSKVITEHIHKSEAYSDIARVISVNILYFDFGEGDDYIYYGSTNFQGLHFESTLQLSSMQQDLFKVETIPELFPQYYLIKVKNFNDIARTSLDEWIYFLKNEEIKESFTAKGLKKAKEELNVLKLNGSEKLAYDRYISDLHYQASMVESSFTVGELKGIVRGRAEGREEGRQEGREEGKQEGLEEGRLLQNLSIAQKLLTIHDIKTVSEITGLAEGQLKSLTNI